VAFFPGAGSLRPTLGPFSGDRMSNSLLPTTAPDTPRTLSWWPLLRSFRLAFRLRQLMLAAVGLLLTTAALRGLEPWLPGGPFPLPPQPWEIDLGFGTPTPLELVAGGIDDPQRLARNALGNVRVPLGPARDFIEPAREAWDPRAEWHEVLGAGLRWFVWVAMWSIFGTALCRSAAVEFAREQSTHIWGALRFGATRAPAVLGGLLLPLVAVAGLGALLALGGLLGRLPYVGPLVLAVVWGLQLIVGVLLMVVLLGLVCGWPLMFATVAVEGTDAFDALSRSYNYLYERPLRQLAQVAITLVWGSFATFCVLLLAQWVVQLTLWGTSWGATREVLNDFAEQVPALLRADTVAAAVTVPVGDETPVAGAVGALPRWVARGWFRLLATLVTGFVYSFFFSSMTVMYFLLRQSVDGNDLDEVYLGNEPEPDDLLPLVGAAAMGVDLSKVGQASPPDETPPDNPPYPAPR
jgi:hypothetical protein